MLWSFSQSGPIDGTTPRDVSWILSLFNRYCVSWEPHRVEISSEEEDDRWKKFYLKEEHSLHVAWDLVSPCRDFPPLACTQNCKETKTKGLQQSPQGSIDQEEACKTIKK